MLTAGFWCVLGNTCLAAQTAELREAARQIVPRVRIENDAAFFAAWDLDRPGMEAVKAAAAAGDLVRAKTALKNYFLKRRQPRWKINHWDMPPKPRGKPEAHSRYQQGEDVLAHRFSVGGFDVDFGDKIDWNHFPLKLPNGKPDTEYPLIHAINRFGHLSSVLGPLYWFSRDERYAKEFVYEVTDHVLSNPAPEKYLRYTSVWSRLTACVPLNGSWLDAYNYFLPSKTFTPEAHAVMLKGFIEKARYVCALRITTASGTDYYVNDLRQAQIGPVCGRIKQAGPIETDARAAVVRVDGEGRVIAGSATGAIVLKHRGEPVPCEVGGAESTWRRIEPLFTPPPQFAGQFGDYRSPLEFYDGRPVRTAEDWQRRRREILDRWHAMMGPWPPVIEEPKVEVLHTERRENFTQHQVRLAWLPDDTTEGYLLVPDGQGPHPAVLVVYYEPETAIGQGNKLRDFAYQLTRRGFVTLSIGNREGLDDKTYAIYYPTKEKAAVQPLSALAYAAANAYHALASRPEVDPKRVGVVGHSFGGKWAMFAACLYDKFACAAWSDPGIVFDAARISVNYWEPWYLGYEAGTWRTRGMPTKENPCTGLYPKLVREGFDLHELHALMAPRPFLVSGGSEDQPKRWVPLNHTIAVNKLLGYENRVAMTNRPVHGPTAESNEQIYLFFEHFLKHNKIADVTQ